MSSSAVCAHCGCNDIDYDPARGDAVCTSCGSVLEDQIIVSEVQFQENSAGGASVIGQYVSADGPKSHSLGSGFHHGVGKESRTITLQNGKRRIQHLGAQLKLNQHCIDTAFNFYKMAVSRRLTYGRKTNHVIGALVYIVCRTEGTSHMLLDLSDVLQLDVYTLGRTYLDLSKSLHINIPALDPCLYIPRFAHKLEFADKTHDVSMCALRLVQRMKRDWMAQGRRPSGLCGAALLVAGRIHNFNRTIRDIIKVVRIGEGTIRKRLAEFEATPSSSLTIEEFQKIDLEEEMDPPCFTEGKKRAKIQLLEDSGKLPELQSQISELQSEIETALEEAANRKRKLKPSVNDNGNVCSTPDLSDNDSETCSRFVEEETLKQVLGDDSNSPSCDTSTPSQSRSHTPSRNNGNMDDEVGFCEIISTGSREPDVDKLAEQELENILMGQSELNDEPSPVVVPTPSSRLGPRPTAASLGLKESIEECMKITPEQSEETGNGDLDLTGIDDNELDKYILSKDEVKIKEKIWLDANSDYLKELEEKIAKAAKELEEGKNAPEKKKRTVRKKQPAREAHTAAEAIQRMLQEKKISSKINYDVLRDLNKTPNADSPAASDSASGLGGLLENTGPLEATPVRLKSSADRNRFKRSSLASDQKQPAEKKPKIQPIHIPITEEPEIVVESGPVDYSHADEDLDEEEEEEDEGLTSAAQLFGHTGVEVDEDDMYDDDVD